MDSTNYIVELRNVSKSIKKNEVLKNINMAFEEGKIYGIVGPNASGKTMLFRAVAGLLYISSGEIKYLNDEISMGVIVENPGFLLSYTGFENLQILAKIKNQITDDDIRQALSDVGLESGDKRKVKEYSLGMKQKLAIAQAIMEKPQLLILDEPTRGLDPDSVESIRELLRSINQAGTTILLSSHNLEDITELCDTVHTMADGKLELA